MLGDCLGSFCDTQYHPSICSPKTIKQVQLLYIITHAQLLLFSSCFSCNSSYVSILCVTNACSDLMCVLFICVFICAICVY